MLYLQDGQNLFRRPRSKSQTGRWLIDVTTQKLITGGAISPLILVGIDNAGVKRADDYTPVAWRGKGGHADAYADLLKTEIMPFVERTFRTRTGPESTAIGGSSLGGLFALYAGLRSPDVFGRILAMSPSVFWGDQCILGEVERSRALDVRIWLDVGRHETTSMRKGLRRLQETLTHSGWRSNRSSRLATLQVSEDPTGNHDEASWGGRFGRALRFLFPAARTTRSRRRRVSS